MNKTKSAVRFPTKLSFLRFELKGCLALFILSTVLSALAALLDLINPKIVSYVIDYVLHAEPVPQTGFAASLIALAGGTAHIRQHLYLPAISVIAVALAGALARYTQGAVNAAGAEKLTQRMRNTLFSHADRLPMSWYNTNAAGDLLQRCTSDVETVKHFVSNQLTSFARIILLIVLSTVFMANINIRLMLIAAAFIPVIVGYSMYFHGRIGQIFMKAEVEESVVSSIVQENLTGIRVVRAFGREAYECDRFIRRNAKYTDLWVRLMRLMSVFWSLGDLFSGLQVMTVVVLGAVFCVRGELTAGNYIAFVSYNAMLSWPIRELGRTIADLSRAGVSIDRIREILNADAEQIDAERCVFPSQQEPLIAFDHVSYSYHAGSDVLKDISFHVKAGEKIGIIGGTGAGKSTLTDLLLRTCDPNRIRGTITFMGKNAADYPLADYRRQFARVLQEPFLFSGTIAQNIAIADETLSDAAIRKAAEDAALLSTVEKFPDGLDTYVGERGVTLSGGQKQRCAIAASLAKQSRVLIFDDAFSALDAETDAAVRKTLFEAYRDKTMILIAHRITAIAHCDRIYVLDKGEIADVGTHAELISRKGIYRDIYELQSGA